MIAIVVTSVALKKENETLRARVRALERQNHDLGQEAALENQRASENKSAHEALKVQIDAMHRHLSHAFETMQIMIMRGGLPTRAGGDVLRAIQRIQAPDDSPQVPDLADAPPSEPPDPFVPVDAPWGGKSVTPGFARPGEEPTP